MQPSHDPKAGERAYYARLGEAGQAHARGKPFSDPRCGHYLADMGALLLLLEAPPGRILDLGCGTGWTSRFLARAGYGVVGLDISQEAVDSARQLAAGEGLHTVEFVVGDYESASTSGPFDAVLFYDALHHAEDESAAVAAAYAALRPGGMMVAFEPGRGHSRSNSSRRAIAEFGVHEKDMPPATVMTLGRRAGFQKSLSLPAPHDLARAVYRRDYHASPAGVRLGLEKLWGCVRAVQGLAFRRRGGMTVLWK